MNQQEQDELALAYRQARELLEQTRDYLLRLPPVPVTRDFAHRIEAHLKQPAAVHLQRAFEAAASEATLMTWGRFMPNGEPFLNARVQGRTLSVWSPHLSKRKAAAKAVVEALEHRLVVDLEFAHPPPNLSTPDGSTTRMDGAIDDR